MGSRTNYSKFIVHDKETNRFTGFIVPDHYGHSYGVYRELIALALLAIPSLDADKVDCLTVTKSGNWEGHPVIRFECPPLSEIDIVSAGWTYRDHKLSWCLSG